MVQCLLVIIMQFYGLIHGVDLNTKVISIKKNRKVYFFYFQNSLMHLFRRYLYQGVIIDFEYNPEVTMRKNYCEAYLITQVYELYNPSRYGKNVFYNKNMIDKSLKNVLNSLDNMLFLDLEMTMPEYGESGHFTSQIIQAGFYLTDSNFNELYKETVYIKPYKNKKLSRRTIDFLKISTEEFEQNSITYNKFYDMFKNVILQYNPSIIIYGKNDKITLERSYEIHKKESLKPICRFINLVSILKQFYSLKSDPGLFKLYEYYYKKDADQKHDALDDAYVTSLVFKAFLENINKGDDLKKAGF